MDNIECYLSFWTSSFFYYCSLPSGISIDPVVYFVYFFFLFSGFLRVSKVIKYSLLRIILCKISFYINHIPEYLEKEITQS